MRTPACFLASILVLTASPVFAQTNVGSCDYLGEQHDGSVVVLHHRCDLAGCLV